MKIINVGDTVYFARVIHQTGVYEVCELHVRTTYPESFVGVDKNSRQAHIISYGLCDVSVFEDRDEAVKIIREAEKHKEQLTTEVSDDDS